MAALILGLLGGLLGAGATLLVPYVGNRIRRKDAQSERLAREELEHKTAILSMVESLRKISREAVFVAEDAGRALFTEKMNVDNYRRSALSDFSATGMRERVDYLDRVEGGISRAVHELMSSLSAYFDWLGEAQLVYAFAPDREKQIAGLNHHLEQQFKLLQDARQRLKKRLEIVAESVGGHLGLALFTLPRQDQQQRALIKNYMTSFPSEEEGLRRSIAELQALSKVALVGLARFGRDLIVGTDTYKGFFRSDMPDKVAALESIGLVERGKKIRHERSLNEDIFVLTAHGQELARILIAFSYSGGSGPNRYRNWWTLQS